MKLKISELKAMLKEGLAPYLQNPNSRAVLKEAFGVSGENAKTGGFNKGPSSSGTFGDGGKEAGPIKTSELTEAINEVLEEVLNMVGKDGKIHVWPDPDKMTPEDKANFERETGKKPEQFTTKDSGSSNAGAAVATPASPAPAKKWGTPRNVQLQEGKFGFGYQLMETETKALSVVVEDHDQIALAKDLGWDGHMVSEAFLFLENNVGKVFKDPGYFISEKRSAKDERQIMDIKSSLRKEHKKNGKWDKGWDEDRVTSVAFATFNKNKKKTKKETKK